MAERFLVTGCAGFIASNVADLLLTGRPRRGGRRQPQRRLRPAAEAMAVGEVAVAQASSIFICLDITNRQALEPLFAGGGRSAAVRSGRQSGWEAGVRPSVANPWVYYQANCDGTLNLLDMCRRSGVRKFLLASTSSLYGLHNRVALPRGRRHEPAAVALRGLEEGGRNAGLRLPPPARASTFRFPAISRSMDRRAGPT